MALPITTETRTIYGGIGRGNYKLHEANLADLTTQSHTDRADAKRQLEASVERALTGSYQPVVIYYAGLVGVAHRTPFADNSKENWMYSIHSDESPRALSGCSTMSDWTRATVERDMRRHMAQMLGDAGDALLADDPAGLQDHREYEVWQRAYKAAMADGYGDDYCRELADIARREYRQLARAS